MTGLRVVSSLLLLACSMTSSAGGPTQSESSRGEPRVTADRGDDTPRPPSPSIPRIVAWNLDESKLSAFATRNPTPSEWNAIFAVYVLPESGTLPDDQPPLSGRYQVAGGALQFFPKYPLARGMTLRARLDPRTLGGTHEVVTDIKTDSILRPDQGGSRRPSTSVRQVYPTVGVLPENLLRFYIQFSAPMSQGEAYRHVRLLDEAGKPVLDPFLELDEELWTRDGRRFTLLFDPGRIKRGLKPREEVGPILEEGKTYTLEIDRSWPDANGDPLIAGFRKSFRVGPPDSTTPDPAGWKVDAPRGASLDLLKVRFAEPLDRALALRLISVRGPDGMPVEGSAELDDDQTSWRFTPESSWQAGKEYRLVIGTDLEDLAGNGIGRPFEVDMTGPITSKVKTETVSLPFRVGPAAR